MKDCKFCKVIMVHGWGGTNEGGWFIPLKNKLEKEGMEVISPNMPDTFNPKIDTWTKKLKEIAGKIDANTYFIGHSIGCQTIMRYLEKLDKKTKVGGAVLIAAWFRLTNETWDEEYTEEIAKPWIEKPIDFEKIKEHTKNIMVMLSEDDEWVPVEDAKIFREKLNAKVKIIDNRGHIEELNDKEMKEIINFIKK